MYIKRTIEDVVKNISKMIPAVLVTGSLQVGIGCVICLSFDLIPIDQKNWYIPVWII